MWLWLLVVNVIVEVGLWRVGGSPGGEGLREVAMVEDEGEGKARDGARGRLVGVESIGVVWRCRVCCDGEDMESSKPVAAGATGSGC